MFLKLSSRYCWIVSASVGVGVYLTYLPLTLSLPPSSNVLTDQRGTQLFGLRNYRVPGKTKLPRRVVDRNETLPLLHSEWLILRNAESDHLALSVESVQVDVGDATKRT